MRKTALALAANAALAACAASPGSQSMMISEDTALISIPGRPREAKTELIERALLEAAAITRSRGFPYFTVLEAAETAEAVSRRRPGNTIPNQNMLVRGTFSNSNLSATFLPGATYTTPDEIRRETRITLDLTIRMYRAGGIDPAAVGTCGVIAPQDSGTPIASYWCNPLK
jgi:hypothetical protein